MRKIKLKFIMPIIGSAVLLVSLVIINETVGNTYGTNLYAKTPLTWSEIYDDIPRYLFISLTFGILTYILFFQAKKKNK